MHRPSSVCFEPLHEGPLPNDHARGDGVIVHSLTAHAMCVMDRHKWIESEKRGYDVGDHAHLEWIERHWRGFVRAKLLEHLYGLRCWSAFEDGDYGLLARSTVAFHIPQDVLDKVIAILLDGGENLDVITWAITAGQAMEPILWLLDRIDINAKRHRLLTDHIRLFAERT